MGSIVGYGDIFFGGGEGRGGHSGIGCSNDGHLSRECYLWNCEYSLNSLLAVSCYNVTSLPKEIMVDQPNNQPTDGHEGS